MTKRSERKERTLPSRDDSNGDERAHDSTTGSTTVVELSPADPNAGGGNDGVPPASTSAGLTVARGRYESAPLPGIGPPVERGGEPSPAAGSRIAGAFATMIKILAWAMVSPFLIVLPFIIVLRMSVVAYQESTYTGWESLGVGLAGAVLLVCLYIMVFLWSFGIRWRLFMPFMNVCLAAMLCYSGYALFHLAVSNAKTEEVRSYYTTLHPFLRVAVKNMTFIDRDLVITDMYRSKDEYRAMGLEPREYSLHFKQPTGFVHAVDLRTNGRPKFKNIMIELYFIAMGFETLRHVGTADHLHVSLPLSDEDLTRASRTSGKDG